MDPIKKAYSLLKERNGYLAANEARKNGVSNKTLQRMADRNLIERIAHGLYIDKAVWPDAFFIAQYRCPKGIFSHETALFLHGLCDRDPRTLALTMTIPSGWNTKLLTDKEF